jgi:Trypsin-like peptidase domain
MFHQPPNNFLNSAYRIEVEHTDDVGTVKSGAATGFVLTANNRAGYIVTNRHVVDLDYRRQDRRYANFAMTSFRITGRRSDDSIYTFRLHPDANFYHHDEYENDVVMIEPNIYFDGPAEADRQIHWHYGIEHLADDTAFEGINPFDLICYAGFPDQHDKLGDRPIVRSGRIASDPRYDYSWDRNPHGRCVAYDGFSYGGASGSPVFAPPGSRNGFLVGVNAGHVPHSYGHSGISYFYKSTVLIDIIRANNLA